MKIDKEADQIVSKIIDYIKEFSPYEYIDQYSDDLEAYNETNNLLATNKGIKELLSFFTIDIEECIYSEEDFSSLEYKKINNAIDIVNSIKGYKIKLKKLKENELEL